MFNWYAKPKIKLKYDDIAEKADVMMCKMT